MRSRNSPKWGSDSFAPAFRSSRRAIDQQRSLRLISNSQLADEGGEPIVGCERTDFLTAPRGMLGSYANLGLRVAALVLISVIDAAEERRLLCSSRRKISGRENPLYLRLIKLSMRLVPIWNGTQQYCVGQAEETVFLRIELRDAIGLSSRQ